MNTKTERFSFGNLNEVSVENTPSWSDRVFLTFDLDWCSDHVLEYCIDLVEEAGVPATWFVTHETPLLERLRENNAFTLGIHPNFNPLLLGDTCFGRCPEEVVEYYRRIVPEARVVRSHSMTQNSNLLKLFADAGLQYDCNHFIPTSSEIQLKPWKLWDERIIKIPYQWEDDIHCIYGWTWDIQEHLKENAINVFDFHPIHVYLNTEDMARYENTREIHKFPELAAHRNTQSAGTSSFLQSLLARIP